MSERLVCKNKTSLNALNQKKAYLHCMSAGFDSHCLKFATPNYLTGPLSKSISSSFVKLVCFFLRWCIFLYRLYLFDRKHRGRLCFLALEYCLISLTLHTEWSCQSAVCTMHDGTFTLTYILTRCTESRRWGISRGSTATYGHLSPWL